ncbi:histidine phosphatase family protein [Lysobacter sp. CFH 32150]|uniref:histidine phosphatase family protein n=1 Tax=Lysobacter sp. CFH 32150 TaxID=2927128 RepID=UPI001FA70728|nr:histidine phosphatase family protein [Lysobacter sp. CFH 32150]MCI4568800.1 histidine phosphatase family protein [Lysobacter sp. CFH 32150]
MAAIYLIRHGQASFGDGDYDRLSGLGIEQSRVLGESLRIRVPQVDLVVCGGMQRHRQTAEACLRAMQLVSQWDEDIGWNEYDHEELIVRFEPRYVDRQVLHDEVLATDDPHRAFQHLFSRAVSRWVGGEHDADYTESFPGFCTRANDALQRLAQRLQPSQNALVFTSGGPISALAADLLRIPRSEGFKISWTLANAAVTKLVVGERGVHLSTLNEHAHFEGAHRRLISYR